MSFSRSGSLHFCAMPRVRRAPLRTSPTTQCLVEAGEFSKPAAWWAFEIDARRRAMVAGAKRATTQDAM